MVRRAVRVFTSVNCRSQSASASDLRTRRSLRGGLLRLGTFPWRMENPQEYLYRMASRSILRCRPEPDLPAPPIGELPTVEPGLLPALAMLRRGRSR